MNRQERRRLAKGSPSAAGATGIAQALQRAAQLHEAGKLHDAEAIYRDVLSVQPNNPDALHLLGVIAHQTGHHIEAIKLIQQAIAIMPKSPMFNNIGGIAKELGHTDEALGCAYRAIALQPDYAEAHNNIGVMLKERRDGMDQALTRFFTSIALKPTYAEPHNNMANAFQKMGRLDLAMTGLTHAIKLKPDYAGAYLTLGTVYQNQGLMTDASNCYQRALSLKPDYANAHSNLLMCLGYTMIDSDSLFAEYKRWEQVHARACYDQIKPFANDRSPDRTLKIGIISADLKMHPIAYNMEGLFACHDREQIELHCYAEVAYPDAFTEKLRGYAKSWTTIVGRKDENVAEAIRADGIDILVSLAGHTAENRPRICAFKPAPVQVSYADLSTTGLRTVDYWLTDPVIHPEGHVTERFTETLVRIPNLIIHDPPDDAPDVSPLPCAAVGHVTFGSFNNPAKVTPDVVKLWARVMHAVPNSRLLLKFFAILGNGSLQLRLWKQFEEVGIDRDRVEFLGENLGRRQHLDLLSRVDIALDPFPFNGCTTSFEALWMGVPVITLAGSRFLGRMGASFLTQIGLPELIAETQDDYVSIVAALAADRPRLQSLRTSLRQRVAASPLCDPTAYARSIEAAFRDMWRKWCADATP